MKWLILFLVKAGQLQLPIDKFVSLNLELEVDRAGADGIITTFF